MSKILESVKASARKLHASGNIDDVAMREFDEICQNSSTVICEEPHKITEGGCCVFHDIGLCTEDIIRSFIVRNQYIEAVKLLKFHGFTLKESRNLVDKILDKFLAEQRKDSYRDWLRGERQKKIAEKKKASVA